MPTRPNVLAWAELARTVADETGLDPAVILATVDRESQGSTLAVNATSGATGLLQVIPKHHTKLIQTVVQELNLDYKLSDWALLRHAAIGMRVGARHLAWCVKDCGSVAKGLARYHTGDCLAGDKQDSIGTPTTVYVADIMALIPAYRAALSGKETTTVLDMTPNLIPLPPIKNRIIPDSQNRAWDSLGQRVVKGIVLHRMQGTLWGTDGWFRTIPGGGTGGLTDYGIDAITGEMVVWNDPLGKASPGVSANRAGWASGRVSNPYGDGKAFIDKYGTGAVNRDQASIEMSGYFIQPGEVNIESPVSDIALSNVAQTIAHHAHNYKIKWSDFPIAPQDAFSFVRWHQEITIGTGKLCPGKTIMEATNRIISMTKEIMRKHQTNEVPSKSPPKPEPATIIYGQFAKPTMFTTMSGAVGREYGSRQAPIKLFYGASTIITGAGIYYGQAIAGENRWLLDSATQARVHASGLVEPLPDVPEGGLHDLHADQAKGSTSRG